MDNKRKAGSANAVSAAAEQDERNKKKQRLAEKYNFKEQPETRESTSEHGLFFLELVRRTSDKNGRRVAGYFETLPPRAENRDYYKKTKMPISLEMIEQKLNNHEFATLTEVESYFKRMVSNAKEYYSRNSSTFEDAERVRKALSNHMTKVNPAYHRRVRKALSNHMTKVNPAYHRGDGYTAFPTPIPSELQNAEEEAPETPEESADEEEEEDDAAADDDEDDDDEDDDDEDDDDEDDDDGDADVEDDGKPQRSGRPSIILRRGSARKSAASSTPNATATPRSANRKGDDVYVDIPYKECSFQEAQEKIVEELIRKTEDDSDEPQFEIFLNLPSRSLKDYYAHVSNPLSIKKLQKRVKGVQGRGNCTHVSEFKSWAAFKETASLIWTNAQFYNEEDSEYYAVAGEFKNFFLDQLKQAKKVVEEPPQPKIKLKVTNDQPISTSKKITIQLPPRGGSTSSPAPPTPARGTTTHAVQKPAASNGATSQSAQAPAVSGTSSIDKARSASVASPGPALNGIKRESTFRPSPVMAPAQLNGTAPPANAAPALSNAQFQPIPASQQRNGLHVPKPMSPFEQTARRAGKGASDALIQNLRIQTHPVLNMHQHQVVYDITPLESESQQSVAMHLPANHLRVQIILTLPPFLQAQQRQYKIWAIANRHVLSQQVPVAGQVLPPFSSVFEAQLNAGSVNVIEVHVIAALPKAERTLDGPEAELEQFTVLANVMRN
ncbi:Protein polybromo-1 like protein [Verticillium longisporum]|uniref:Protein polybromo-1 like protein n=1 Tax=Verticillium longisporum TaxID=100787 RepID=A0A8I2Z4I9_VERLO|nr:Protein polybromo-1 like protein [Verticillium longisporum]